MTHWLLFLLRRLLAAAATLAVLALVCLALVRAVPGGPFDSERSLPPEIEAALAKRYGTERDWFPLAIDYVSGALRGDLGPSFQYPDYTVVEILARTLPITLALGALAALLAIATALPLAAWLAPGRHGARLASLAGLMAMALPKFVLAPLLVWLFALEWRLLPAAGFAWDSPRSFVLPVLCLALPAFAVLLRAFTENLRAALTAPPALAARARGYSVARVVWRHALPLALAQSVGYLGPLLIALLTGSAVVEQVFGIPGLGRTLVAAAQNRDHTLLLGAVLAAGLIVTLVNLAVDVLQHAIDPRTRV